MKGKKNISKIEKVRLNEKEKTWNRSPKEEGWPIFGIWDL